MDAGVVSRALIESLASIYQSLPAMAGIGPDDPPAEIVRKLRALINRDGNDWLRERVFTALVLRRAADILVKDLGKEAEELLPALLALMEEHVPKPETPEGLFA